MSVTRRDALQTGLFGAGWLALRSMATGLPAAVLLDPVKALADPACFDKSKAQFVVMATSSSGDPMNANVPGMYEHPDLIHPEQPEMAPTPVTLGGTTYDAALPWASMPQQHLARTCFFHHATLTNAHQNQSKVQRLMGSIRRQEMLVSLLAKNLAPCLGTVQKEPVSIGAAGPGELLTYEGRVQPAISPTALRDLLISPAGPLTTLQKKRDSDLDRINQILKDRGTSTQRAFLDRMAVSQQQARTIAQDLLDSLSNVKSNNAAGQVTAAVALIRMRVAPVVAIRIGFGGDNHADADLQNETNQTVAGVQTIVSLLDQLKAAGLGDQVTFMAMNVFGRTLSTKSAKVAARMGRDHYASHHCTVMIGKGLRGSVVGGCGMLPKSPDFTAMPIDSKTGAPSESGDISFDETLGSMGRTFAAAVGVDPAVVKDQITAGKIVTSALA